MLQESKAIIVKLLRYNGLLSLQSFSQQYQHDKSTFYQLILPHFLSSTHKNRILIHSSFRNFSYLFNLASLGLNCKSIVIAWNAAREALLMITLTHCVIRFLNSVSTHSSSFSFFLFLVTRAHFDI